MNMLIPGVIFLVALLAIGGVIWLAMGERRESGSAVVTKPATNGQASAVAAPATGTGSEEGKTAALAPTIPVPLDKLTLESTHTGAHEESGFPALNGQFYELAAELRTLHSQAQDIERRLGLLTEMINRIEQEYGEIGVEAE